MAGGYESRPDGMAAIVAQLAGLQRQINELRAAAGLRSAVISDGGLTIKKGGNLVLEAGMLKVVDQDGTDIAIIGRLDGFPAKDNGDPQVGFWFGRESGETAGFNLTNVEGGLQSWAWTARDGQGVIADDAVSGVNLARPYLPIGLTPSRYTDWPSSTSSAWETVFVGFNYRQHPQVIAYIGATSDVAGTSGEVRLVQLSEDGSALGQLGPTIAVGFSIVTTLLQAGMVYGGNTTIHNFGIQVRRTAGTGAIRCQPQGIWGVQS